jgi:hypothetical protein
MDAETQVVEVWERLQEGRDMVITGRFMTASAIPIVDLACLPERYD